MAKRFTDTDIWDKEWFMNLDPTLKCLVNYVRDKCNLAGVWHPNYKLASTYIGEPVNENILLSIDDGKQFLKLDCGKVFCIGFINFQYGEKLNEKSPVHKKIIDILNKHYYKSNLLFDTVFNRVLNTLQEEEEEEEKEEVKDFGKHENLLQIPINDVTLEAAERNQYDLTKQKNTEFIKSQFEIFKLERVNDPPIKKRDYTKHPAKLYSHFLNWLRNKKPVNGKNNSGNSNSGTQTVGRSIEFDRA